MSEDAAASQATEESGEPSLGSQLRAAREERELSIEKIADELRIEENVLHALEEDRLGDIHVAPVFIKGYIKQYGRLLELDYEVLRAAFDRQTDTEDIRLHPNKSIQLRDERQITIWVVAGLAVLLVVIALFVWWLGGEDDGGPVSGGAAPISGNVEVEVASEAFVPAPAVDTQPDAEDSAPADSGTAVVVQSQRAPGPSPSAATAELTSPDDAAAQPELSIAASPQAVVNVAPVEPEPGAVEMLFEFSAESWFELTDARGRRLHYDLAEAGSRLRFMALPPAQVLIGDADAVSITVAAQSWTVPGSSRRGNVASFAIDPTQD